MHTNNTRLYFTIEQVLIAYIHTAITDGRVHQQQVRG